MFNNHTFVSVNLAVPLARSPPRGENTMENFHKHQHNRCIIYRRRGQTNEKEEIEWMGGRGKKENQSWASSGETMGRTTLSCVCAYVNAHVCVRDSSVSLVLSLSVCIQNGRISISKGNQCAAEKK